METPIPLIVNVQTFKRHNNATTIIDRKTILRSPIPVKRIYGEKSISHKSPSKVHSHFRNITWLKMVYTVFKKRNADVLGVTAVNNIRGKAQINKHKRTSVVSQRNLAGRRATVSTTKKFTERHEQSTMTTQQPSTLEYLYSDSHAFPSAKRPIALMVTLKLSNNL